MLFKSYRTLFHAFHTRGDDVGMAKSANKSSKRKKLKELKKNGKEKIKS